MTEQPTVVDQLREDLAAERSLNALMVEENLERLELAAEDREWRVAGMVLEREFTRTGLSAISRNCQLMAIASPMIKRGVQIRTGYIWGQGVTIQARSGADAGQDVNTVVQDFLDDPGNKRVFSSAAARERCERTLATDGNWFLAFFTDPKTGRVSVRSVPFAEIQEKYTDPDDREQDQFFLREWSETIVENGTLPDTLRRRTQTRRVFHPAIGFRPVAVDRVPQINGIPVDWETPILHVSVNRPDGWKWGVPDVYAALPWARAYEGFLTDWARLVKSLSKFAWRITGDRASKAQKAADKIRAASPTMTIDPLTGNSQAGQASIGGPGVMLEAIPKSGATIDADSGRPLAAMVAAALGLTVVELLADPGVTGARAVAETLDKPTILEMGMRQEMWADVIQTICQYVITASVEAVQGVLTGVVDQVGGRPETVLAGDVDATVLVDFPDLNELDSVSLVNAIVAADGTGKMPPLETVRMLLVALGVEDVDEIIEKVTDENGDFIDAGMKAAADAVNNQRNKPPVPPVPPAPLDAAA